MVEHDLKNYYASEFVKEALRVCRSHRNDRYIECVFDITNHVSTFFHACPSAILNLAKEVRIIRTKCLCSQRITKPFHSTLILISVGKIGFSVLYI